MARITASTQIIFIMVKQVSSLAPQQFPINIYTLNYSPENRPRCDNTVHVTATRLQIWNQRVFSSLLFHEFTVTDLRQAICRTPRHTGSREICLFIPLRRDSRLDISDVSRPYESAWHHTNLLRPSTNFYALYDGEA